MKVVSIANAKGGVGKTTTAVNMAAGLALLGKKVLLADMDYQANATCAFLEKKPEVDLSHVLFDDVDIRCAVIGIYENLDLLPSGLDLSGAEAELSARPGKETSFLYALENLDAGKYDFLIADLPPNAGVMSTNALAASDYALIPVQTEYYAAIHGVETMNKVLELVKKRLNRKLELAGVVATMFDVRKTICHQSVEYLKQMFGTESLFNTVIRTNVALAEAPAKHLDIFRYSPKSNGAEDYNNLCVEFVEREAKFNDRSR